MIGLVHLFIIIIFLHTVAVGNVTPDGLATVVVTIFKSFVNNHCACAFVQAVTVGETENVSPSSIIFVQVPVGV